MMTEILRQAPGLAIHESVFLTNQIAGAEIRQRTFRVPPQVRATEVIQSLGIEHVGEHAVRHPDHP